MNTWLLTWNPNRWPWDFPVYDRREASWETENYGFSFIKWTCGVNKSIKTGDRVFLIKLGAEPRGIIASGKAVTDVFSGTHYDEEKAAQGIKANRIYVKFDKVIGDDNKILPMEQLIEISDTQKWSSQSSGISIDPETAEKLEEVWAKY